MPMSAFVAASVCLFCFYFVFFFFCGREHEEKWRENNGVLGTADFPSSKSVAMKQGVGGLQR